MTEISVAQKQVELFDTPTGISLEIDNGVLRLPTKTFKIIKKDQTIVSTGVGFTFMDVHKILIIQTAKTLSKILKDKKGKSVFPITSLMYVNNGDGLFLENENFSDGEFLAIFDKDTKIEIK